MAKKIRHGPRNGLGLAIAIALSILLFGCGGGANQPNIQQENTAPSISGGDLLSIDDVQNKWSPSEMRGHIISDPDGLFTEVSRRTASAVNGVYPYKPLTPERQSQVAEYVAFQLSLGMRREDIIIPAQLRPELTEEFLALTRDRLARRVSAVSVVELEPSAVGPFGSKTVAYFAIPGDTLQRLHTLSVGPATTSTGKYWVVVANYSTGRWDLVYSGEGSITPNPVAMHSLERLDRYASDPVRGSDMYIAVIAEPTAVIQRIYAGLADRDDLSVRIGSRGYNFSVDALTTEADGKSSSSVTSDLDGDEIDIIYTYDHVPDGLDTVAQTYMKDNNVLVGGVEALKESIVNNDDNTILMDPPSAGSHTIKVYTISFTGVSADEIVGTVDLDLQPVTGLQATFSGGDVVLTWTEPAQGVTNNIVYRSANGGAFSQIAEVGDVVTHNDTTPPSGYCSYKVVAKWVSGEQTELSADSAVVTCNTIDGIWSGPAEIMDGLVINDYCTAGANAYAVAVSSGSIHFYQYSAGVWSDSVAVTGYTISPRGLRVDGSTASFLATSPSGDLERFTADLGGVVDGPEDWTMSVVESSSGDPFIFASANISSGRVAYAGGAGVKTLKFYSANPHQITLSGAGISNVGMIEVSGKPFIVFNSGVQVWVARSTMASPTSEADWEVYQISGISGAASLCLLSGLPAVVTGNNGSVYGAKTSVEAPGASDWSVHQIIGGSARYEYPRLKSVSDGVSDHALIVCGKRADAADTTTDVVSLWCAASTLADPQAVPGAWGERSTGVVDLPANEWGSHLGTSGSDVGLVVVNFSTASSYLLESEF